MASVNKAMIIGRLGQDPDVRATQNNTTVANMSVATSERYKDKSGEQQEKTEWHRITAWGRLGEICQQYLKKGSLAYFEGPIQTRKWQDKDGQDRYSTEITALSMQMLDSRGADQDGYPKSSQQHNTTSESVNTDTGEVDESDDLPF